MNQHYSKKIYYIIVRGLFFFFFFGLFAFSRAAPAAYGGSQARGLIGAIAASLRPQQLQIQAASATSIAACCNAGFLSH